MFKQYQLKNYRFRLVAYVIVLTIIGILVIGSAKQSVQSKQILGLAIGLVFMVIVSLIDYSYILRFWSVWYLMAIFMQVAVLLFGNDVNGSKRWIDLGFFQFQPSELSKILLICFWAAIFVRYHEKLNTLKMLVIFIVASGIPMGLILVEDMSTTIVIALIFITLLFIAGLSYKIILKVLAAAVPAGVVFLILLLNHAIPMQEYRYNRILAWLNPEKYSNGAYQQQNSIMAIGSGQLWGKGLNNTSIVSMKNGNFIAEPQTDFIFAVVGEEDADFAGGSYVFVQKYIHDMVAWNSLPVEEQEKVIGRRKFNDVELSDEEKPQNAHNAVTNIGDDLKIVRANMPFANTSKGEYGTYFIGYASTFTTTRQMLESMFIGNPVGNTDRLLDFSTAVTGTLFFAPSYDLLSELGE